MHSPKVVASKLDVSKSMIYKLINQGLLNCYRIGTAIKVTDDQIKEYLERSVTKKERAKSTRSPLRHLKKPS